MLCIQLTKSLNLKIERYVLKVLTNNTSGTGKNVGGFFSFTVNCKQQNTIWRSGFGKDF
jgi:hypothetical protein